MTDNTIESSMHKLGVEIKSAASIIANASTAQKNQALVAIAEALDEQRSALQNANQKDLQAGQEKGLDDAMLDRLTLSDKVIDGMIEGVTQVAHLDDPVGEMDGFKTMPSGIQVGHMRVPLGVIGIIYESRPNVTVDAAALCIKSGNATLLRGGSEAIHSNRAVAQCVQAGLEKAGLPAECVALINTTDRSAVGIMLKMSEVIDVIIPRGGKGLIQRVTEDSVIPVIKHLDGICHIFIDQHADEEKAINITVNAKTQRLGTCNTLETLLVDEHRAAELLPTIADALSNKGVELRGCEKTQTIIDCKAATDEDWETEYLDAILSIKVVNGTDEAIQHINRYGSQHTDSIITDHYPNACDFLRRVDSASVMVNASTRFADGFEYGLGAEIGISTDKIHARGPVGLHGLTSVKYIVLGDGHIRT